MWSEVLEYGKLSWPEVKRAAEEGRVQVVPIGTLEDHGYHLPIDTDVTLVEAICRGAVGALPHQTVLLPPIVHGYSPHHMDFPGTITIGWDTFCRYVTDVALSLVRHGFERVLLVNGHGSNQNLVEMAARLTMVEEPNSLVAATFYLVTPESQGVIDDVRTTTRGGMGHACELETSLYLHLHPDAVDMTKAVDERESRDRQLVARLVRWTAQGDAVVVELLRLRRAGRCDPRDRGKGRGPLRGGGEGTRRLRHRDEIDGDQREEGPPWRLKREP